MFEGFFKRNLNLKILSLILSVCLWLGVHVTQHIPVGTQGEKSLELPLSVENLSPNLLVLEAPSEVFATVSAQDKKLSEAEPSNFKAFVDVKGMGGGAYQELPVRIASPSGFTVISISPRAVNVVLDEEGRKDVPVTWEAAGIRGKVQINPAKVTVNGSKLQVGKVMAAQIDIPEPSGPANLLQLVAPLPVDALGRPVPGLQIDPPQVQVMILPQQVNKEQPSKK